MIVTIVPTLCSPLCSQMLTYKCKPDQDTSSASLLTASWDQRPLLPPTPCPHPPYVSASLPSELTRAFCAPGPWHMLHPPLSGKLHPSFQDPAQMLPPPRRCGWQVTIAFISVFLNSIFCFFAFIVQITHSFSRPFGQDQVYHANYFIYLSKWKR